MVMDWSRSFRATGMQCLSTALALLTVVLAAPTPWAYAQTPMTQPSPERIAAQVLSGVAAGGVAPVGSVARSAQAGENQWVEPTKRAVMVSQRPRWAAGHPVLCGARLPVCVHARTSASAKRLPAALKLLEQAYSVVVHVLSWQRPLSDGAMGGTNGFDVYFDSGSSLWTVQADPLPNETGWTGWATTSGFALVNPEFGGQCALYHGLVASVAHAGVLAIDGAANAALASATASYVASLVAPCDAVVLPLVEDFQSRPDLAVSKPAHHAGAGALLFPWFVQQSRGRGNPVDLLHYMWSLGAQGLGNEVGVFYNEPDFLDSVAILARGTGQSVSSFWLDFAVARAFVGDRDSGLYFPGTGFLVRSGAVRFEWAVSYASLPRRLAPRYAVEPTGSSYVYVSLDSAKAEAGLGVRAQWQGPEVFRFALVTIDAHGFPLSRYNLVSEERRTSAEYNVEDLAGAAGVVVVATNVGSILTDIAFDPDNYPYVARPYTLSLFAQK